MDINESLTEECENYYLLWKGEEKWKEPFRY
jgi:hypothetical protein